MKTRIVSLLTLLAVTAGCSSSNNYTSLTKEQTADRVQTVIADRRFEIAVDRALPFRGRNIQLTGSYSLRISGDSVYSHLPYYGRAYTIPYGGGEGMIFDAPITNYTVAAGKKGESVVSFTAQTREDRHRFDVTLWPTGSADIRVTPNNRQSITYTGTLKLE